MDYTKNIGHTISFTSDLAVCREPVSTLDVSDDYLMFDNPEEATFTRYTKDLGRDGKMNTGSTVIHLCHVGRYVINYRDLLDNANGHLKVGDIRAEVSVKELTVEPLIGDELKFSDKTYHVLGIDKDPLTRMYILWCRE
jgi:hypothetical protein